LFTFTFHNEYVLQTRKLAIFGKYVTPYYAIRPKTESCSSRHY
jgi:hypothetical protein